MIYIHVITHSTHTHTHTHTHTFTAPTEPQNFTLATIPMSPQQLQASWTIPNPTNGLITNYTIQCSSPDAPSFTEVVGNVTSFVLDRLNPFTNYSCNVSATTVAGEGRSSGIVTAQTDEDGKCSVCMCVCV